MKFLISFLFLCATNYHTWSQNFVIKDSVITRKGQNFLAIKGVINARVDSSESIFFPKNPVPNSLYNSLNSLLDVTDMLVAISVYDSLGQDITDSEKFVTIDHPIIRLFNKDFYSEVNSTNPYFEFYFYFNNLYPVLVANYRIRIYLRGYDFNEKGKWVFQSNELLFSIKKGDVF